MTLRLGLLMPLLVLALATTVGAAGGGGGSGDGNQWEGRKSEEFRQAASLVQEERFEEAISALNELLAADDGDADAHNLLGYATRKLGRYEEALGHYERALRLDPGHLGAHEYIGEAYLALNQPDKAREHLSRLDSICWLGCDEYDALKEAIAQYEAGQR